MESTKSKAVSLWLKVFALGALTLAYSVGEAIGAGIYWKKALWVTIGVLGALFLVFVSVKPWRRLLTALLSFVGIITAFVWPSRTVYLYTGATSLFLIAAGAIGTAESSQDRSQSELTDQESVPDIPGGYTGRIITFVGELMEVATWIMCFLLVVVYEFQLFPLYQWLSSYKGVEMGIAISCTACIGTHIQLSMDAYDPGRREYRWVALEVLAVWAFVSFFSTVCCSIREWWAFFISGSLIVLWCSASLFMKSFAFLPLSQERRRRNDNLIAGSSDEISRRTRNGKSVGNIISAPGGNYKSEHNENGGTNGKQCH